MGPEKVKIQVIDKIESLKNFAVPIVDGLINNKLIQSNISIIKLTQDHENKINELTNNHEKEMNKEKDYQTKMINDHKNELNDQVNKHNKEINNLKDESSKTLEAQLKSFEQVKKEMNEAIDNCPQGTHLCSEQEVLSGAWQVARNNGWLRRTQALWFTSQLNAENTEKE